MNTQNYHQLTLNWIKTGAICGLLASMIYPALIFIPLPDLLTITLAAALGLLIAIASIGLFYLIKIHRETVTLKIAVIFNIIGATTLNLMLMVQLTIRQYMSGYLEEASNEYAREQILWIWRGVDKVQLGLDVSWDVYFAVGTFLFALNLLSHPRFGKIFGGFGLLIALLLLGFNLYSFPFPPAEAGLVDFGPATGMWYLLAAIQALRSLKWADQVIQSRKE